MLGINDVVVALFGTNFFFPNKPRDFQDPCVLYARIAVASRAALVACVGWKSLLFLFLAESLWSLPPHPASAMFVTNHGSGTKDDSCYEPTSSTYAGAWYSILTLGTNYHCEHHDFPRIPFHLLYKLRQIAPEFYNKERNDDTNLYEILRETFAHPDCYAAMTVRDNNEKSVASG